LTISSLLFPLENQTGGVQAIEIFAMSAILNPDAELLDGATQVASLRPAIVRYFLRRCGNVAEAEDLAQDVMERALGKAHWESTAQAKNYIYRTAVNRWHDRNRRRASHGTVIEWDDAATFALAEESSPERVISNKQELHAVVAALRDLGERTRDVFMLCRLEQMKHSEIAELYGISVSAVEKHVAKAVAHLARFTAQHA
jgi:RNA polymerase sigma factor (sigma-70 family)